MRLDFWRGIIAGSLLGVLFSLLLGRPEKKERRVFFRRIARQRPRTRTQQLLRGVTRTVGGMIK